MLKLAEWIWNSSSFNNDEYVDFTVNFNIEKKGNVKLEIACDGMFAAYLNGKLACFAECSDDENNKLFDIFNLDKYTVLGENKLDVTVWHHGAGSATYKPAKAGLIFVVQQKGVVLAKSSTKTLSRLNSNYKNGYNKYITFQLGLSYKYDNTFENNTPFTDSVIIDKNKNFTFRDIENLVLEDRVDADISYNGNLVTVDMHKETVGFLELDIHSDDKQELLITYGERLLLDGKVDRIIETRDFSVEFVAKKGENHFIAPLRRLAGRYIQFEVEAPVNVRYAALRPVIYPVKCVNKMYDNALHQKIYDTCIYTLKCCMHAHYEDCPWREQALYALDSRNQMLSGYIAFNEYRFARHNLILLSKAFLPELNLLNLTYPKSGVLPIPFFSLIYVVQVYEYVSFSGDVSILNEVGSVIDSIINGFAQKIDETGLIQNFPYPCWNFYEWTDGNHNQLQIGRKENDYSAVQYDLILNATFVYACSYYKKLTGKTLDLSKTIAAINKTFYNSDKGLYVSSTNNGNYSVIANSMAILCGVADKSLGQKIIEQRNSLVDVSLSMNGFFYQALLDCDEKLKDYVVKDIEKNYGYMLSKGATTFWETIYGAEDFNCAGSLCHGWSAIAIYWLNKLV